MVGGVGEVLGPGLGLPRAQPAPVRPPQVGQQELGDVGCRRRPRRLARRGTGLGQRRDQVGVPLGEDLVVQPRPHPCRPGREERGTSCLHLGRSLERPDGVEPVRDRGAVLEVPARPHVVPLERHVGVGAEHVANLRFGPHVEPALLAFAVGVFRGRHATARQAQVVEHVADRLSRHLQEPGLAGQLPAVHVEADQQGVVVEHLLEVRHQPGRVDRVAGEAAAEVVVDAARRQVVEGAHEGLPGPVVAPGRGRGQHLLGHRLRELGGAADPAVDGVDEGHDGVHGAVDVRRCRPGRAAGDQRRPAEGTGELIGLLDQLVALVAPDLLDPLAELDEAEHAGAAVPREVGAGEERAPGGGAEDGHRPPALAGHRLRRLHVDVVDVRPLLAVDLHVDEAPVHHRRDVGVLEGLVGHDVAPVAGRVADRQQDRHVPLPGGRQRLLAPRVPVDRVVGVLAQVRAGLCGEAVRHHAILPPRAASSRSGRRSGRYQARAREPACRRRCPSSARRPSAPGASDGPDVPSTWPAAPDPTPRARVRSGRWSSR